MLKATPARAILEATLTALIWLVLLFAWVHDSQSDSLRNVVSSANTLAGLIVALRARPLAGWQELVLIAVHTWAMLAMMVLVCVLFAVPSTIAASCLVIVSIGTPFLAGGARLVTRFWVWWNQLRQRHIAWALTHAHLTLVELPILSGLLAILLVQLIVFSRPFERDNPQETLVDYLLMIEPYITVGGTLTFLAMLIVLPPSALFSYMVSRRLVRRILVLEQVTARVEQGDYSARVPVQGRDEIARLQARYNQMTETLGATIQKLQIEQATVAGLSKLQRDMVANISHDLRTPLATLQVYLDTLPAAPETDLIRDEIEHLRRLTDDLFEAAKQETLTLTLRLTPMPIQPLLEQIITVTQATARELRQVEILLEVGGELPRVVIDGDRFSQIVRNLLQNALRWTPPGGMIHVSARREGSEVRIDIQDTGIGMAEDELSKIWRRTYQVEPGGEGSGLGLANVKGLVEAMQGRIEVQSVVNSGTCFRVFLPGEGR